MKDSSIFGGFPNWKTIPKKLHCSLLKIFALSFLLCYYFSVGAYIPETFAYIHTKCPLAEQYLGDS